MYSTGSPALATNTAYVSQTDTNATNAAAWRIGKSTMLFMWPTARHASLMTPIASWIFLHR